MRCNVHAYEALVTPSVTARFARIKRNKITKNLTTMACEHVNLIVVQQHAMLCLFFLSLVSTQRGYMHDPYTIVIEVFDWVTFEENLDKELFYNVHRMDKSSFRKFAYDLQSNLRNKHKRNDKLRLSYECMAIITLSCLGGDRIC